jgi:chorismate mutase / prephenate dehydratase
MKKIKVLRTKINQIDNKLIDLIHQRTGIVLDIGQAKTDGNQPIYSPQREKEVYRRLLKNAKGPMPLESLKAIFREIMSGSLALEKDLLVSYLGPRATFTHQAALSRFGSSVQYLAMKNINDVFNEVEKGYADYGVVPIENSMEGAVNHTLDMFVDSDLKIYAEIYQDIAHHLMASNNRLASVKRVYSNPQAFGQCRGWLLSNVPNAELIEVSSTTRAAEIACTGKGAAAIASDLAAKIYRLKVAARSIQDSVDNITRFLVIAKTYGPRTGQDRTSIMFSVKDKVGALHDVLGLFSRCKINLTKIESRPSKRKPWEYYFFVDFNGHSTEKRVRMALNRLSGNCQFVKVLGSYPRADEAS